MQPRRQHLPASSAPLLTKEQQGVKDDSGKLRYDLMPYDALEEVLKILAYGAARRGERNWEQGIAYSRVFAASQRHLACWFQKSEQFDSESQLSHLAHAACNILFLLAYELRKVPGLDDRPSSSQPRSTYFSLPVHPQTKSLLRQFELDSQNDDEFPDAPRY